MTAACGVCRAHEAIKTRTSARDLVAWESERWIVRHHLPPAPLPGWFLLDARRHVQGPADFNVAEQREFGGVLSAACSAVKEATGSARVYVIMFGEGAHHLHAHLVPRHEGDSCAAWAVADWYRDVERGLRVEASPDDVARVVAEVRDAMREFSLG